MPIWWRIGCVGFVGFGDVANTMSDFRLEDLKYSVGFGLRFMVDPREKINLLVDFGFGEGSSGIYIGAIEVF